MSGVEGKASFFRQSGWMILATVAGGVFMIAVHSIAAPAMTTAEYAVFGTLLRIYLLMGIPAAGLQTVFAQRAAAAQTDEGLQELGVAIRRFVRGTFMVWLIMVVLAVLMSGQILRVLQITHPAALWFTLVLGLATLWMPILRGVLQGRQDFAGLGWTIILDGTGRFAAVALLVGVLRGQAAGGIAAALLGQGLAISVGAWFTRRLWLGLRRSGDLQGWLRRVLPLTFGSSAVIIMTNTDMVFVQSLFPADTAALYLPGYFIGFALAQFTMPIAVVMFPKIARSAALAQQTDALRMTLISSAVMGGMAALACTFLPELPLRILYHGKPEFLRAAPLVPWFAWCLLVVSLANVLVANLLARDRFAAVPWLVLIAVGYVATLLVYSPHLVRLDPFAAYRRIVAVLGTFSLLLFAIAAWFNWRRT